MKNLFRISGIALLTVLYCFTISFGDDIFLNSGLTNQIKIEKAKSDLSVSVKLYSNTSQAESLAAPSSITAPSNLKSSFNEFFAKTKITEKLFSNAFSQYIFTSRNFLVKCLKTYIIFPFHYFW